MAIVMIALKDLIINNKISAISRRPHNTIKRIKSSIEQDGLLNPLMVIRQKNKYVVIDGKKRLIALRALARSKLFQRALGKVPCLVDVPSAVSHERRRPILLTAPELAHKIIVETGAGISPVAVAQRYDCDYGVVEDAMLLPRLHPEILMAFNNGAISLSQAAAFAALDNLQAQWSLLLQLGPFVSNTEIMAAIKSGEAVIDLPNGEVIIMPSRSRPRATPRFDTLPTYQNQQQLAA